ncbi:MAG: dUTP diphosphatase [Candidatus Pacebacteria bacterium]|nr:dUTP diphosphatase [Candidatus Paceibacterota bacterium]
MKIKIKKMYPDAIIPKYAHPGDAGMDLYTVDSLELLPGERKSVPLGIAMEIPSGYVGLIWDKSGLSHKYGVKTLGGVIDSIFRGELQVGVINLSDKAIKFEKGHKIAQLLIQKVEEAEFQEVDVLSDSQRGNKGFGSTGK